MIGILLAAGFSCRFGSENKLLQPVNNGRLMAELAAEHLIQAIPTCIAVIRSENLALSELFINYGFNVVLCEATKLSMADSLVTAINFSKVLNEAKDGYVIALADMPYIKPDTIKGVADKVLFGASIAVPTYQEKSGHPVGFSEKFTIQLQSLKGDEGARSIIKQFQNEVEYFPTDDSGILIDIDTQEELNNQIATVER